MKTGPVLIHFGTLFALTPLIFSSAPIANGQDDPQLLIHRSRDTGLATFLAARGGGPIFVTPDDGGVAAPSAEPGQFLDRFGRLFGISDRASQLPVSSAEQDLLGHTHTKYIQQERGVPVFSGQVRIHQDDQGRIYAANGFFRQIPDKLEVRPTISADAAVAVAAAEFDAEKPHAYRVDLTIVDPGWYGDPPLGPRLAYYIGLEDPATMFAQLYFVDAHSGKIIDQWVAVEHFRFRQIHDGMFTTDLPGVPARFENGSAVFNSPDVNRAYDYYGDTYDYFWRGFGRDSMDGLGIPMVATVNSIAPGCPNAFWSNTRKQMAFCVGTVTDDITAHELTHGLTYFTAELIYQNQSGQLNESFSDVFGELVDLFNGNAAFALGDNGGTWPAHSTGPGADQLNSLRTECSPRTQYYDGVRWLVGEDAFAFGGAIRDMWDPTCRSDPDRALSELQTCGPGDNGGVHSGSGIPNHAFAILVDGKEFNGFSVKGIGPIKAGAVWYRALTTYLAPTSDFEDAYLAFTQAARDLVGQFPLDPRTGFPSSKIFQLEDVEQVDLALRAVEMNGPGRCGWTVPILRTDAPPNCGDDQVVFFDDFESGAPGWTVANSMPFTPYDWKLTDDPLPYAREGVAWMCENKNIGDCAEADETGWHVLISPPITLPQDIDYTLVRFTHHIDVEAAWDGGLLSVRVNDGRWHVLPTRSFEFNPYNTTLRTRNSGNSNPLAGHQVWSGIGGNWGTTVADISWLAGAGDTIELRFEFGKDGCGGRKGWFVDDVAVFGCKDCNRNGYNDSMDIVFSHSSGPLGKIGVGFPQRYVLSHPPLAADDVLLQFYAIADLFGESQDESLFVSLNGTPIGEIFASGARDCPASPDSAQLLVARDQFNSAALSGAVTLDITATNSVDPGLCGRTSWVRVDFEYPTSSTDDDGDGVPDECQSCQVPSTPRQAHEATPANRYLAFMPENGGAHVAYRLGRTFGRGAANLSETVRWVGPPVPKLVGHGEVRYYARPQCEPFFAAEWESWGPIYISDEFVIPGAVYTLDAMEVGCSTGISAEPVASGARTIPIDYFSKPLTLSTTSKWGDVTGSQVASVPDGKVDFLDVAAVVDSFVQAAGAVDLHRSDLAPEIPNRVVDFADISAALDAYRGLPFPYTSIPQPCPARP